MMSTRVFADRRSGSDRRDEPRRQQVMIVAQERRQVVDRRRGAERPVEHVRNALQLLREIAVTGELSTGPSEDLGAAIERLYRAVALLEHQPRR